MPNSLSSRNVFVTADLHLGHANIIRLANRPFSSVEEMDERLVLNWNSIVPLTGTVYILGDFAWIRSEKGDERRVYMKKLVSALNGKKILLLGNHDKEDELLQDWKEFGFSYVGYFLDAIFAGRRVVMCHYPLLSWHGEKKGALMLHGHCHGKLQINPNVLDDYHANTENKRIRMDVGVDTNNYYPYKMDNLLML